MKLHFNSNYNFYQQRGLVKNLKQTYVHAQRYQFEKLGVKKHNKQTVFRFLVAQFQHNPQVKIQDVVGLEGDKISREWNSRIAAMDYTFDEQTKMLLRSGLSWKQLTVNGEIPLIMRMMDAGDVTKETVLILDTLLGFSKRWESNIITDEYKRRMNNYQDFININRELYIEKFNTLLTNKDSSI